MATRYSDAFNIVKDDIGKSVIRKRHDELTEWWVYREKQGRFVDSRGKEMRDGETYLYCIIVCTDEGVRQQNEQYIALEGVKFTEKDLDEYLSKTGRS